MEITHIYGVPVDVLIGDSSVKSAMISIHEPGKPIILDPILDLRSPVVVVSDQVNTKGVSRAPITGQPNSTYEQVDANGNVTSRTTYGSDGKQQSRDDYNHTHFDKNTGQHLNPHRHLFEYNSSGQPVKPKNPVIPID